MKRIRYSKYVPDFAGDMSMEDLLGALSDYFLQSGFNDNFWYELPESEQTLDELKRALEQALLNGEQFDEEMRDRLQQMQMEGELDELIEKLIERMQQEDYISIDRPFEDQPHDPTKMSSVAGQTGEAQQAKFEITDKSLDFLGFKALRDLLGSLGKSSFGRHDTRDMATGIEASGATRQYEFGDTMNLDITATLSSAIQREGLGLPLNLEYNDLQVHQCEYQSSCATVLMLDCSHSMILYGEDRFTPAKKVAMALSQLIRTQYPGDSLSLVLFHDSAEEVPLIHAVKMEPDRGFPQAASAHDTFWDFISLTPEAMHMIMWAMSDRTLPRSLRMIEGFGVHSFRLVNEAGESTFVKYHWRPKLGLQSTVWDEAVKIAGADPDFHRRDMFEAIAAGQKPEWEFAVQLFTQAQADAFPFDHLDATKLIPEELVPLQVIGRIVLDRWPDNFFAETEQVAFCPSHLVPGIDFSNDPLLRGRLFSYLDTQLSRLGSPNFHQIPVNAPKCPFANQQRDGHMQMAQPTGRVAYEPSSLGADTPREHPAAGFRTVATFDATSSTDTKGRIRAETFADHYSQARQFFRSQTPYEQAHMASALVFELSKVEHLHVRVAMVGHLLRIDESLAQRVADGLGLQALPAAAATAVPAQDREPSPALRTIGKGVPTLEGRAVAILVTDGSDARLIASLRDAAQAAGASVKIVAPKVGGAMLDDGTHLAADGQLAGTPSVMFDAVAVIVSSAGAQALAKDGAAVDFVRHAFGHLKAIAFDAGGQALLQVAGVEPDPGVVRAHDAAAFIEAAATRQWAREAAVRMLA